MKMGIAPSQKRGFQSLLGILKSILLYSLDYRLGFVSIPPRYSKINYLEVCNASNSSVSIPPRYSKILFSIVLLSILRFVSIPPRYSKISFYFCSPLWLLIVSIPPRYSKIFLKISIWIFIPTMFQSLLGILKSSSQNLNSTERIVVSIPPRYSKIPWIAKYTRGTT